MFVKTITLKLAKTNLKDFYITGERISVNDHRFQKFFNNAVRDGAESTGEEVTYHLHTTLEPAHDEETIQWVGEKIIDLSDVAGRVEARKRLNFLKHLIQAQQKEKTSELFINGYRNTIGWFRLESGDVIAISAYFFGGGNQWRCISWPLQRHSAGGYFFSETDNRIV